MKSRFKSALKFLKNPPAVFAALAYILTLIFIAAALTMLSVDYSGSYLEYIAYISFALAAITLAYSVYLTVHSGARIKTSLLAFLGRSKAVARLIEHYGFRTIVFASLSLALNVAYSAFFAIMGILSRSVWYGSLAAYYLLLTAMRGGIVFYRRKANKTGEDSLAELKKYRTVGILLSVMPICLSFAIAEMVANGGGYKYGELMIYAVAAYTFYKLTMSVINTVKARSRDDVSVRAARAIGLADSGVSLLALQSALLNSFAEEGFSSSLANALTGAAVCIFTLAIGIYMLVSYKKSVGEIYEQGKI